MLIQIHRSPGIRVSDVAAACLLTDRAVQRIISDLEDARYLSRERHGRTNRYHIIDGPLRHPADAEHTVAHLLSALLTHSPAPSASALRHHIARPPTAGPATEPISAAPFR